MASKNKKKILIVDDDPVTLFSLNEMLKDSYTIIQADNGIQAISMALEDKTKPDIILLDVIMPEMGGHKVCEQLKINLKTKNIPIFFLTIADNPQLEVYGLDIGAVDYIKKPIHKDILIARIETHLELKAYRDNLEKKVAERTKEVKSLNKEIIDTQKEIIFTLGDVVETRSKETFNHVQRVSEYIYLFAQLLGLGGEEASILKAAAPMHDVGKIGIPEVILNKPGELTPEEREIINTHARIGYDILNKSDRPILKAASIIAYQHHERWDGTGYPQGLKEKEIHLYGRMSAIIDVFDALINKRCYKPAMPIEKVINVMQTGKGTYFDPVLSDFFLDNITLFEAILKHYPDRN